jgi:phosphohistidine phosphatase
MKYLHLLRHAKSSWNQPGLSDRQRRLNKRGRRDAPRMGAALAQVLSPVPVAVSPAKRAQLTLEGLCAGWPELAALSHDTQEDLYTFSGRDLFEWVAARPEDGGTLFIISHNPGLTELVNTLVGDYCLDNLPTAGYVQLELQIDRWQDLRSGCAVIGHSLFPRQLAVD